MGGVGSHTVRDAVLAARGELVLQVTVTRRAMAEMVKRAAYARPR